MSVCQKAHNIQKEMANWKNICNTGHRTSITRYLRSSTNQSQKRLLKVGKLGKSHQKAMHKTNSKDKLKKTFCLV